MLPDREELNEVIELVAAEAATYLQKVDSRPVRDALAEQAAAGFEDSLPEEGAGASQTLKELIDQGFAASVNSAGPRFFHFVVGGTTPAAFGADWLTTLLDQVAYAWVTSPLAVKLELVSLSWLRELFDLPSPWSGVMTTGATMANFVGLASARQWYGEQHGVDVAEEGLAGLPRLSVLSSGYIHASAIKALAMLGVGRSSVRTFSANASGCLDLPAMQAALDELKTPAIIIANAGEVNTGDFDPIASLASLAGKYGAWLHVDGAFGLFARVSPRTEQLASGVEKADSVTVDGHKWLNVPYDCGFSFVRDQAVLGRAFAYTAAYLPALDNPHPNMGSLGPESSRRARSLAVWATLRAYGRQGYRALVEHHLALAERMAQLVDAAPDLERLADVRLNIVCFRYNPGSVTGQELDELNGRLGQAILQDGRVYAGTTVYKDQVALRPAISNWRTTAADVEFFVEVVRELAAGLKPGQQDSS